MRPACTRSATKYRSTLEFLQLCRMFVSETIPQISRQTSSQRSRLVLLFCPILAALFIPTLMAQTGSPNQTTRQEQCPGGKETGESKHPCNAIAANASRNDSPKIQDNSFLVEEAYNQEYGVVQHIQNLQRFWDSKDWVYTFTQEWPVDASPRHQLSYTLAALHSGEQPSSGGGFGDVMLNYRYQLVGDGEARTAFAPRLSVLLPTGDYRFGRGTGGLGIQGSLPLSVVLTRTLVTHWNAGTTIIPNARNAAGESAATFAYNFGQSFVWLAQPRFNVLLETVFNRNQEVTAPNATEWRNGLLLSPGIRWAYNFKNGLQIVPGIAAPFGVGPSAGERGVFLYLSFEHPYRKLSKR